MNLDKSKVSFSRNVWDDVRETIRNGMGVKTITSHAKYLEMSVVFGRSKKDIFDLVIERV